mmetsp:Transcript_42911/g.105817  ORF Transcript_42911/g.105817 Transcript_42911/m.105817 type:complete len:269 (+) Transcript_42911:108-914(+)
MRSPGAWPSAYVKESTACFEGVRHEDRGRENHVRALHSESGGRRVESNSALRAEAPRPVMCSQRPANREIVGAQSSICPAAGAPSAAASASSKRPRSPAAGSASLARSLSSTCSTLLKWSSIACCDAFSTVSAVMKPAGISPAASEAYIPPPIPPSYPSPSSPSPSSSSSSSQGCSAAHSDMARKIASSAPASSGTKRTSACALAPSSSSPASASASSSPSPASAASGPFTPPPAAPSWSCGPLSHGASPLSRSPCARSAPASFSTCR